MNKIIEKNEFEIYDKMININLFNRIIAFIHSTSNNKKESNIYQDISKRCIWNKYVDDTSIKDDYQFQYFGELLERYEERIGNDIRDIRAISLALGYAKNFVENNMIVGTQLIDFINKIENLANDDIYLKGALYLYDSQKFSRYNEELLNKVYKNTEEIIFSMSIFYERIEDFFIRNRQQLVNLLGKNRNMPVLGNVRIYEWLIKNLYPLINKDRKKDIILLKSLIKLPTGFQKEDSSIYKELINNNYTQKEISYLNYLLLYYKPVPKSVPVGYSIVEEKIATNLCEILINSKETHNEATYELIKGLLQKYDRYQIKCYGYMGIKQALEHKINIVNPITFAKLYYDLDENLYSFNILSEKWNIVASHMDSNQYQKLFDKFLNLSNYTKKELKECINKYNILTNKNYIDSFLEYKYNRESIFSFLVNNNVILLKDIYESSIKRNIQEGNKHLKEYIRGINNKKAFEFLKYILRLNKYNIEEINRIGFKFEELIRGYHYCYEQDSIYLRIERKFLNLKNYKILLDCLEKFIFYNKPEIYFKFMKEALNNDIVCKIYKKDELRKIYFSLCEIEPKIYQKENYQKRYLNKEELEEIYNQKRLEKELKKKKEIQEAEDYLISKFIKVEKKNSFENLYNFCFRYDYSENYVKVSTKLVKQYILENIKNFSRDVREISSFIKLIDFLIDKKKLTSTEFAKITFEYSKLELEVEKNEYIDTTCRVND